MEDQLTILIFHSIWKALTKIMIFTFSVIINLSFRKLKSVNMPVRLSVA